jgi:hypothetical protein
VTWVLVGLLVVALPLVAAAQRGGFGRFGRGGWILPNVEYDGRYVVARVRYAVNGGWRADYPDMERNLTGMLQELTAVRPVVDGSNVHTFDDPELLKYPVAYLSEPGYWYPSQSEVEGLQRYLAKGGFLIVDDFHYGDEWSVFEYALRQVLPGAKIETLERSHPIFNSFFEIETLAVPYPGTYGPNALMGEFFGIYEDNDPAKRLSVIINYNMDLGDYVEHAGQGRYLFAETNEAYKFMINYVIYGLSR